MKRPSTDLWAQLDGIRAEAGLTCGEAPAGSITSEEYATRYGIARTTARAQLAQLVKHGAVKSGTALRNSRLVRYYVLP